MKNKFLIKIVIFVVMSAAMGNSAMGQKTGFAGEPQKILLRNDSETTELGIEPVEFQGDEDDAAYNWTIVEQPGGASLGNQYIAQPILTVTECGEHILQCVRCSKYGYQTEIVTIDVIDEVEVVSIKCKHQCFPVDSWTTKDDYIIETDPPGNEDVIEIVNTYSNAFLGDNGNSTFLFTTDVEFEGVRKDGTRYEPDVHECEVVVVNSNFTTNIAEHSVVASVVRKILWSKGKLDSFDDKIRNFKMWKNSFFDPIFSLDFKPNWGFSADCCDHKKTDLDLLSADIVFQCGLQKRFPLTSFPLVGIEVKFFGEGTLRLAQFPSVDRTSYNKTICRDATPVTLIIKANLYGGGYLSADALSIDGHGNEVFDITGGLNGYVAGEIPFGVSGEILRIGLSLQIHAVIFITILAVDAPIIEGIFNNEDLQ